MYFTLFHLLVSLAAIVIAANLFCNALEHLGEKLGIADGVTGSIFAAVATALPETIIPILALLNFDASDSKTITNHEIGLGAILGAPLMLSTLSLFIMALSVIKKRGIRGSINPEFSSIARDLKFFLLSYGLAFIAIFVQKFVWHALLNGMIATCLFLTYFVYVLLTIKESRRHASLGNVTSASDPLFLSKFKFLNNWFHLQTNLLTIIIQLIIALGVLVYFANLFINAVSYVAANYHISAFLLSLFIIPIATELPEKVNSIIWLSKKKDTLAIGNITGAMMFQGSLLPIIGILFTNWSIDNILPVFGIITTFVATLWFYFNVRRRQLFVWHFGLNGLLYFIYLFICLVHFYIFS